MFKSFESSVYALASSMVIKDHNFAEIIENSIINKKIKMGLEINPSHSKWKYYLNISGEYHPTDEIMTIVSLDTLETIDFTKENLVIHRSTTKGYLSETKYVKELLERYPNNHLLVKSILNPVDINVALNADNYTILQWDNFEVEDQEINLINDIQDRINIFKDNWYNQEFTYMEELYSEGFYRQLIALLPLFIMQCREVNEFTYKVHSYYLWSYLETKAGLYKYKNYLTFRQANWLYRNINYVLTNLGKEVVLADLIKILMTELNIPIGKYTLDHLTEEMDTQSSLTPMAIVKKEPLNLLSFVSKVPRDNTIDYLAKKQIPLAKSNGDDIDQDIAEAKDKMTSYLSAPLKVLETEVISSNENSIYNLANVLINHWAFFSMQNIYQSSFFIRNGKTGGMMTVDAREAFVLYAYLLNRKAGLNPKQFPTIQLRDVINPNFDPDLPLQLFGSVVKPKHIKLFNDGYPEVTNFISADSFREACVEYHAYLVRMNAALEFPQTYIERNHYEEYMRHRFLNGLLTVKLDGFNSVDHWLRVSNWDLEEIDESSIDVTLLDIETKVLAVDSSVIDSATIQKKMTELLNELTSYNIQVVSSGNLQDVRSNQTSVPEIGNHSVLQTIDCYSEFTRPDEKSNLSVTIERSVEINTAQCNRGVKTTINSKTELELEHRSVSMVNSVGYVEII